MAAERQAFKLLQKWYQKDENAIPLEFVFAGGEGSDNTAAATTTTSAASANTGGNNGKQPQSERKQIEELFTRAAKDPNLQLSDETRNTFFASPLHGMVHALSKTLPPGPERSLVFSLKRDLMGIPAAAEATFSDGGDAFASQSLQRLVTRDVAALVPEQQRTTQTVAWAEPSGVDAKQPAHAK